VRLHHRPEALNGGEGIGVTGEQLLRLLKPSGYFTLDSDKFQHDTAD